MKDRYFLDTNIILYSFDADNKKKRKTAIDLIQKGLVESRGRVSFQVIQEFINVASKPHILDLKPEDIIEYIRAVLIPQCDLPPTIDHLVEAIQIKQKFKYSFYDSLIITAAMAQECSILYSEDLHYGHSINGLKIMNPFI